MAANESNASSPSAFLVYGALCLTQLIWSSNHAVLKLSISVGIDPFVMPMLRATVTLPTLFLCAWFKDGKEALFGIEPKRDFPSFILLGLTGIVCTQLFFNLGVYYSSVSDAGLMQPIATVITTVVAMLLRIERASCLKLTGVLAAVGGATLIVLGETVLAPHDPSSPSSAGSAPRQRALGVLCFACNCSAFSAYILLQKPLLRRFAPLTLSFWTYICGGAVQLTVGAFLAGRVAWSELPASTWLGIAYLGVIGTVLTFFTFSYAVKYLPPSAAALGICLQPLFSSLLGTALLDDHLTPYHLLGGLTICGAVALVYRAQQQDKCEEEQQKREQQQKQELKQDDEVKVFTDDVDDGDNHASEAGGSAMTDDSAFKPSIEFGSPSQTPTQQQQQPLSLFQTYSESKRSSIASLPSISAAPPSNSSSYNSTLSRLLIQSKQHPLFHPIPSSSSSSAVNSAKKASSRPIHPLPPRQSSKPSLSATARVNKPASIAIAPIVAPRLQMRAAPVQPHPSVDAIQPPPTLVDSDILMMDESGRIIFT